MDTENHKYKKRLVEFYDEIVMDVVHVYFEREILDRDSLFIFLDRNAHILFHKYISKIPCCKCGQMSLAAQSKSNPLNQAQFDLLYDSNGDVEQGHEIKSNGNFSQHCLCKISPRTTVTVIDMDIILIYTIIKVCCTSYPGNPQWLEDIKNIRNSISHLGESTTFSENDFHSKWQTLQMSVLEISRISGTAYENSVKKRIHSLTEQHTKMDNLTDAIKTCNEISENKILEALRNFGVQIVCNMWLCKHCFTENTHGTNECTNCLRKRDDSKHRGGSVFDSKQNQSSTGPPRNDANNKVCNMWLCKHCFTENTHGTNECTNCLRKRDDSKHRGGSVFDSKQNQSSTGPPRNDANNKVCNMWLCKHCFTENTHGTNECTNCLRKRDDSKHRGSFPPRANEEDDYAYIDETPYSSNYEDLENVPTDDELDYEDLFNEDTIYATIGPDVFKSSFLSSEDETDFKTYLRIVMVGKTGSGKSATGNSLLGKKCFEARMAGQSVTKECSRGEAEFDGRKIAVVDTPGLFDTKLPPAKIRENIVNCIHMTLPGPHVFLLILQIGRFTGEEIAAMNNLFKIFGDCMAKCSIIVFTGLDNLEREDRTIESYINETGQSIQKYIEQCGGRYFAMNNVASDEVKKSMVNCLFTKIDDMVRQNNGSFFSNAIFADAGNNIENAVKEVKDKEERANSEEVEKLILDFDEKISKIKEQENTLDDDILVQTARKEKLAQRKEEITKGMVTFDSGQKATEERRQTHTNNDIRREKEKIEEDENDVYQTLHMLRIERMSLEDDCKEKLLEIEHKHKRNIAEAIEKATEENCKLMNSILTAIIEIDLKIEDVQTKINTKETNTNKKYKKSLDLQKKNLVKEKNKLIRKQSSFFVKVVENSALLERQLNKKDKLCSIM